jgi:hypothetical protein
MYTILLENPWLIIAGMGLLIPILGVVFGTVTTYLQQTHRAELEASLKHAMLERGMSAEDIRTVLEASGKRSKKHSCPTTE